MSDTLSERHFAMSEPESPTDELRRLLDERDAEYAWEQVEDGTLFHVSVDGKTIFILMRGGSGLEMWSQYLTPEQAIAATLGPTVTGETSDGYHTFNELYHHRAVLFSVIVRDHPDLAWKSKLHSDGTMYNGMFIVGIQTPQGQATYHYDIDPYWEMFECRELERAPEWDGHTPDEAIARIATLGVSDATATRQGAADLKAENAKLRELVRGLRMAYIGALNECEGMDAGLIWEHCEMVDIELAKSHARFEAARHRFDVAMSELGMEVGE